MQDSPLISVIVPIYKVEPYLRQCLDSIVNQTYANLEIILVDDGSPDGCPAICDEYAAKDNRIVVIHKENGGLSDARNAGLDICKGEYISFVDSDDWIASCCIETLLDITLKESTDISIGNFEKNTTGIPSSYPNPQQKHSVLTSTEAIENLFSKYGYAFIVAWVKLYKKELFETQRYPKGKLYEDAYVTHLLYNASTKISFIDIPLYYYRQRSDSIMGQTTSSIHAIEPEIKFYHFLKDHELNYLAYKKLPDLCWRVLFAYSESKSRENNSINYISIYRESVRDFLSTNQPAFVQKAFLRLFYFFPFLYIFYQKKSPWRIRKS